MEVMTPGRVYVAVGENDFRFITYFNSTNKRKKSSIWIIRIKAYILIRTMDTYTMNLTAARVLQISHQTKGKWLSGSKKRGTII